MNAPPPVFLTDPSSIGGTVSERNLLNGVRGNQYAVLYRHMDGYLTVQDQANLAATSHGNRKQVEAIRDTVIQDICGRPHGDKLPLPKMKRLVERSCEQQPQIASTARVYGALHQRVAQRSIHSDPALFQTLTPTESIGRADGLYHAQFEKACKEGHIALLNRFRPEYLDAALLSHTLNIAAIENQLPTLEWILKNGKEKLTDASRNNKALQDAREHSPAGYRILVESGLYSDADLRNEFYAVLEKGRLDLVEFLLDVDAKSPKLFANEKQFLISFLRSVRSPECLDRLSATAFAEKHPQEVLKGLWFALMVAVSDHHPQSIATILYRLKDRPEFRSQIVKGAEGPRDLAAEWRKNVLSVLAGRVEILSRLLPHFPLTETEKAVLLEKALLQYSAEAFTSCLRHIDCSRDLLRSLKEAASHSYDKLRQVHPAHHKDVLKLQSKIQLLDCALGIHQASLIEKGDEKQLSRGDRKLPE